MRHISTSPSNNSLRRKTANWSLTRLRGALSAALTLTVGSLLTMVMSAPAQAQIVNGSFESNYDGWTLFEGLYSSSPTNGTWAIVSDGQYVNNSSFLYDYSDNISVQQFSPYLPRTFASTDGNRVAVQLQRGPQLHRMYQTVSIPAGTSTLDWDMQYHNRLSSFISTQRLQITVRNTSDSVLAVIFSTTTGVHPLNVQIMTPFEADISAFAGQTVRISVDHWVRNTHFGIAFDNFRFDGGVPPNQPPTVECLTPGDYTCSTSGLEATIQLNAEVFDNDADDLTVSWYLDGSTTAAHVESSVASGSTVSFQPTLSFGPHSVEVVVSDGVAEASCTIDATLMDTVDPVFLAKTDVLVPNDPGLCSAQVTLADPTVSDNCAVASITNNVTSSWPYPFPVGDSIVTWTVTDTAGNSAVCDQTVTVVDDEFPIVSCGADLQLNTDVGASFATWSLDPATAMDNCGVVSNGVQVVFPDWTDGTEVPATFPIGITTVMWTATDAAGNEGVCMQVVTVNARPDADCIVAQLTNIGDLATVSLSGVGSTDFEDGAAMPPIALTYEWTIDDGVNPALSGDSETMSESLPYGDYLVTLTVTDSNGATGTTTCELSVDPALLAIFSCERTEVTFCVGDADSGSDDDSSADDNSSGCVSDRVKIRGEIGLPMGVDYSELEATALVVLDLAGGDFLGVGSAPILFDVHGGGGRHWKYKDSTGALGVTKFEIDWRGARFKFREKHFPVKLRSQLITTTETVIRMDYKIKGAGGAFTVDIDGVVLDVDASGVVTSASLPAEAIKVKRNGKKVMVTLPFALTETSTVIFGGSLSRTVNVADHYTNSLGRFKLEAKSGSILAAGADTTPRTTSLMIGIGGPLYPGICDSEADDLRVHSQKWRTIKHKKDQHDDVD